MAHCFVELGGYGIIGDFDTKEMTKEQILNEIETIADEFIATEIMWTIVENKEDYYSG